LQVFKNLIVYCQELPFAINGFARKAPFLSK